MDGHLLKILCAICNLKCCQSMQGLQNLQTKKYHEICKTIQIMYPQTSNISHTLAGNMIVDHSDVVGASPVGAAPTASSFSA